MPHAPEPVMTSTRLFAIVGKCAAFEAGVINVAAERDQAMSN